MTMESRWSWTESTGPAVPLEGSPRVDLAATPTATAERDILRKPRRSIESILLISTSDPSFSEGRSKLPTLRRRSKRVFSNFRCISFLLKMSICGSSPQNFLWVHQGGGVEDLSSVRGRSSTASNRTCGSEGGEPGNRASLLLSPDPIPNCADRVDS